MLFKVEEVRAKLPGRQIDWYETVGSTMTLASELAREGAPHGTIVGAEEQTAGIGRMGRSWDSQAGAGLYVSLILRPNLPAESIPLVMLALGLATKESMEGLAGLKLDLRWPNDILIREKKCAGMLAQWEAGAILAGIGNNVGQTRFPEGLDTPATSLRLEGAKVRREELLAELAPAIDRFITVGTRSPEEVVRRVLHESTYVSGRRVRVEQPDRTLVGVTCGLDASGFLKIREDDGRETTIFAGGVRPA